MGPHATLRSPAVNPEICKCPGLRNLKRSSVANILAGASPAPILLVRRGPARCRAGLHPVYFAAATMLGVPISPVPSTSMKMRARPSLAKPMAEPRAALSTLRQSRESLRVDPGFRGRSTWGWSRRPQPASGIPSPKTPGMRSARVSGKALRRQQPRTDGGLVETLGMSGCWSAAPCRYCGPTRRRLSGGTARSGRSKHFSHNMIQQGANCYASTG